MLAKKSQQSNSKNFDSTNKNTKRGSIYQSSKLHKSLYIIAGAILGFIISGVFSLFLGIQYNFRAGNSQSLTETVTQPGYEETSATNETNSLNYQKNLDFTGFLGFDPGSKFLYEKDWPANVKRQTPEELAGVDYPDELLSIPLIELTEFSCTSVYQYDHEGNYETHEDGKRLELVDSEILLYIQQIKSDTSLDPNTIQVCETSSNTKYVAYSLFSNLANNARLGGGAGGDFYFGIVMDGVVEELTAIPFDGSPYGSCYRVLAITSDKLYYECGGGDGGIGQFSIYSINFITGSYNTVIQCRSTPDFDTLRRQITCS